MITQAVDARQLLESRKAAGLCDGFWPVGSRVTCSPPPMDTDEDWLVYASDMCKFIEAAESDGHEVADNYNAEGEFEMDFWSIRIGRINLIASESKKFVDLFLVATSVAKKLNVMSKQHRKDLFQAVMYGKPCEGI